MELWITPIKYVTLYRQIISDQLLPQRLANTKLVFAKLAMVKAVGPSLCCFCFGQFACSQLACYASYNWRAFCFSVYRKHALNCHRMKPALFSVLCEIKEKTGSVFLSILFICYVSWYYLCFITLCFKPTFFAFWLQCALIAALLDCVDTVSSEGNKIKTSQHT